jgi:hypothetical protein
LNHLVTRKQAEFGQTWRWQLDSVFAAKPSLGMGCNRRKMEDERRQVAEKGPRRVAWHYANIYLQDRE